MTADPIGASAPRLPWNRPLIGEEEIAEVIDTLRSGWLTAGPKTAQFEEAFRRELGVESALALSSCTAALHLSLMAAGIGPGDEVITPSLTFCAVANAVVQVGAVPVLVDVEPESLTVDVDHVRAAITERTRAVIPMHYAGHACDMAALVALARDAGLLLIEDAAHALGATYRGRPAGSFGDLATFSFYANKNLTTGEGGMLVGRRDLVDRARVLSRQGIDRGVWQRHGNRTTERYDVVEPGLKYVMSDITASLGVHQLRRLPEFNARRRLIAQRYLHELAGLPGLVLPVESEEVRSSWHLFAVRVRPESALIDRDALAARLAEAGIDTSVHFTPVHRLSRYQRLAGADALPVTDRAADEELSLPCYPAMTDEDVTRVVEAVHASLSGRGSRG